MTRTPDGHTEDLSTNTSEKSPIADVYAGDTSSPNISEATDDAVSIFNVVADSEPGTFARIANVLNIANVAPNRVILELKRNDRTLCIYIEMGVGPIIANSIQRKLAQLTDVIHVDMGMRPSTCSPPNVEDAVG